MTKEEAIRKHLPKDCIWDEGFPNEFNLVNTPNHYVYAAMDDYAGSLISQRSYTESITEIPKTVLDEYSKQQSIAFAEWIDTNGWKCIIHADAIRKLWQFQRESQVFTTEVMYSLFIQDQSTQVNTDKK